MRKREALRRPSGLLVIVGIMAIAIFFVGEYFRGKGDGHEDHSRKPKAQHGMEMVQHEGQVFHPPQSAVAMDHQVEQDVGIRDMESYYALRHYPGAPPQIPHVITAEMDRTMNCNVCHEKGGFVPPLNAYAPVTPHPGFSNCMQCHVARNSHDVFAITEFVAMKPPALHRPALPGGPPPVPHTLQLRDNCLACHGGPSAPREIRTSHPERVHCLQCHVPSDGQKVFTRSAVQVSSAK